MFERIHLSGSISFIIVFLEGVLSFFSPCIIPLIPVFMSYLAGNTREQGNYGEFTYRRQKVMIHTVFFVLGISTAFFVLGMAFTALGSFFSNNKMLFTRVGGILIIILGLFQLGIFDFKFLQRERKINMNMKNKNVNPFIAYIMGFTFSFGWTPCVGPALSSVLILASSAKTALIGNILVALYTVGFVLPFIFLGLFTTKILNFLQNKKNIIKYTMKAGGVLLIIIGFMTFTGWMNGISSYLNSISFDDLNNSQDTLTEEGENFPKEESTSEEDDIASESFIAAPDFTLADQYGQEHTLSDYKGKVLFLNFWATWCPPCKEEMPDIEKLYQEYNLNQNDVIFLGVANPKSDEYPQAADEEKGEVISFLEQNGYTFPTVFDESGEIYNQYQITAFPTTYIIDKNGNIAGYIPGMMTKDIMKSAIEQIIE